MMRIIRTGDPCPICGRPVTAEDQETLDQLTAIAQMRCGCVGERRKA